MDICAFISNFANKMQKQDNTLPDIEPEEVNGLQNHVGILKSIRNRKKLAPCQGTGTWHPELQKNNIFLPFCLELWKKCITFATWKKI